VELHFRRHLNDWEIQRVADFYNTIGPLNGLEGGQGTLWWKGNKTCIVKVNCAYNWLNNSYQLTSNWPWKGIWKSKIPLKVSCFVWLLAKEAVLTQDNLMKRGIPLCSRECHGSCQARSLKPFRVGKKLECSLRAERDGELSLLAFGGQYGRRGIPDVLIV